MLIIIFSEKKGWGHVNVSVFAEEGDTIRDTFEAVKKVKEIAQSLEGHVNSPHSAARAKRHIKHASEVDLHIKFSSPLIAKNFLLKVEEKFGQVKSNL